MMPFTLLLVGILLISVILSIIGGVMLLSRKSRVAGFIVLGVGLLTGLSSILIFLSLVITTRSMG